MDSDEVDSALATLDAYVTKRDVGEAREHGDPARSIAEHIEDATIAFGLAGLVFVALVLITQLPPAGVWTVALAAAFTAASAIARRAVPTNHRLQLTTTAIIATSLGLGGFVLAVLVLNLIW